MITPTFTRATPAYLSDGTQVASGVPRFEWGRYGVPSTDNQHYNKAIMVEEGTTNLCVSGNNLTQSPWTSGGGLVTAYDSGLDETTLTDNNATDHGRVSQSLTLTVGVPYTLSYRVKKSSAVLAYGINIYCGIAYYPRVWLHTGELSTATSGPGTTVITDAGDSWHVAHTLTPTSGTATVEIYPALITSYPSGVSAAASTGSATFKNVQMEQKGYATTYTPSGTPRNPELITIPDASTLVTPVAGTIEMWVYVNPALKRTFSGNSPRLFQLNRGNAASYGVTLVHSPSSPVFSLVTANDSNTVSSITTSSADIGTGWHHFAVTFSASEARLLIDGVFRARILNPNLPTSFKELYIGHVSGSGQCNTLIDSIRISNKARTAAEILTTYESEKPRVL